MIEAWHTFKAKMIYQQPRIWCAIYSYVSGVVCSVVAGLLVLEHSRYLGAVVALVGLMGIILLYRYQDSKYAKATRYWHDIIRYPMGDQVEMTLDMMADTEQKLGRELVCVLTSTLTVDYPMLGPIAQNLLERQASYYYLIPPDLEGEFQEFRQRIENMMLKSIPTRRDLVSQALNRLHRRYTASYASPFDAVVYFKNKSVLNVFMYFNKDHGAKVMKVDESANDKMGRSLEILIGKSFRL